MVGPPKCVWPCVTASAAHPEAGPEPRQHHSRREASRLPATVVTVESGQVCPHSPSLSARLLGRGSGPALF